MTPRRGKVLGLPCLEGIPRGVVILAIVHAAPGFGADSFPKAPLCEQFCDSGQAMHYHIDLQVLVRQPATIVRYPAK